MAESTKTNQRVFLALGPLVSVVILLLSFTEAYRRAELVTYDQRFEQRNEWWEPIPFDARLGTIDIDTRSLEEEGRYQDWTRDKYTDVIRLLDQYGVEMVGFDLYFVEPSAKVLTEAQLLGLEPIDSTQVKAALARVDFDDHFRRTIAEAGNIYLPQLVSPARDKAEKEWSNPWEGHRPLDEDQKEALVALKKRSPKLMVPVEESTLARAIDFEPPLKKLRQAAQGFAYAQTEPDVDGSRRRYNLVFQYGDIVLPSLALMMVCDFLKVPLTSVEVWPGQYVILPSPQREGIAPEDIEIPIDPQGRMGVNWAGGWEETFAHFSHIALSQAARRQLRQRVFDEIKDVVYVEPELRDSPPKIIAALNQLGLADPQTHTAITKNYWRARLLEAEIRQQPQLTGQAFWQSKGVAEPLPVQIDFFENIRRNNLIATHLEAHPQADSTALQALLPQHPPVALAQSAAYVRSLMREGEVPERSRPLYFFPYVKYDGGTITPEVVDGKVLFFGLTADGTTDLSVTPFQARYPLVGIYPNVFNTILQRRFIHRQPDWAQYLVILALGLVIGLVVPPMRVIPGALLVGGMVVVYILTAFVVFAVADWRIEMVGPVLVLVLGYLFLTIYGYVVKEREKEFVQGAFGHYLAPAVVDQIVQNPQMIHQLGGEERIMTVQFSDLASWTTISECLTPTELVTFLNEYLTEMVEIIEYYGGTVDKFEGDAIMAFFGAPLYFEDHAVRGCLACIDQQKKMVELRRRWLEDRTKPEALRALMTAWNNEKKVFAHVRIGLATGSMVVGNMGTKRRADYTAIGDTVNLASRFESGQKVYGTGLMVNGAIHQQVEHLVESRKLDLIQVVGKEAPEAAYEILDYKGELSAVDRAVLELYKQGLAAYEHFDFLKAKTYFERALDHNPLDGPSGLYVRRCSEYALSPPDDLVFRPESK